MSTNLMRANRVAVKSNGENFMATFFRTHKLVADIHSELTEWKAPDGVVNKSALRESFRIWAIENAKDYNIDWDPTDKRSPENIRRPKYETDEQLVNDAMAMALPEMRTLVDKCKYGIEWGGMAFEDEIEPMTHTGAGRELSTMGIINGKYEKSGNWAWAVVKMMLTFKYKGNECYMIVKMNLVSGQLKKIGIGITDFNNKVRDEIIDAELATADELDPPKKQKSKESKEEVKESKDDAEEQIGAEPEVEDKPVKTRKRRGSTESKTIEEVK